MNYIHTIRERLCRKECFVSKSAGRYVLNDMKLFLFATVLLLLSCHDNKYVEPVINCPGVTISGVQDSLYLSRIESVDLIPFERDENTVYLINPDVLSIDSLFFLIDYGTGIMMGISDDSILFDYRRTGRGHGEFISISNSFIYKDLIYVYDPVASKILCYEKNGNFLKSENVESILFNECYLWNDDIWVGFDVDYYDTQPFISFYSSTKKKVTHDFLKLNSWQSSLVGSPFPISYNRNGFSFYVQFGYIIYDVDSVSIKQKLYLDFENKIDQSTISGSEPPHYRDIIIKAYMDGKSGAISNYVETHSYYSFNYVVNRKTYCALIAKSDKQAYSLDAQIKECEWNMLFGALQIKNSRGDELLGTIRYADYKFLSSQRYNNQDERLEKLNDQIFQYAQKYDLDETDILLLTIKLK